jgi:hypothetical protein
VFANMASPEVENAIEQEDKTKRAYQKYSMAQKRYAVRVLKCFSRSERPLVDAVAHLTNPKVHGDEYSNVKTQNLTAFEKSVGLFL